MADYNLSEERQNLLSSNMAYDILSVMILSDEEMYSKEIKEHLEHRNYNTSNASVSNYIKLLRDFGLVERGKRTKAQYYRVDMDGLYQFWRTSISEMLDQINSSIEQADEEIYSDLKDNEEEHAPEGQDEIDIEEVREHTKSWSEQIAEYKAEFEKVSDSKKLEKFVINYFLGVVSNLKINNCLYSILIKDLSYQLVIANAYLGQDNFPDELNKVTEVLLSVDVTGEVNLDIALDNIKTEYFEDISGISRDEVLDLFSPGELEENLDDLDEKLPEEDRIEAIEEELNDDISREREVLLRFLKVRSL